MNNKVYDLLSRSFCTNSTLNTHEYAWLRNKNSHGIQILVYISAKH